MKTIIIIGFLLSLIFIVGCMSKSLEDNEPTDELLKELEEAEPEPLPEEEKTLEELEKEYWNKKNITLKEKQEKWTHFVLDVRSPGIMTSTDSSVQVFAICDDKMICYVTYDTDGVSCRRDRDLVNKYCNYNITGD